MEIKEYKCPNCAGAVKFDSSTQAMKCPYCEEQFEIADLIDYQKELAAPNKDRFGWNKGEWEDLDLGDLASGSCPSCGAELLGDANTLAMVCPCCGNSQIVEKRIREMLKPDYLIPFKLEKKAAVEALKNFYQGKKLLPNFFKEENRVNSIQGVYFPFWLFDAKARARMRFRAARMSAWSDSNYSYTKTDYYSIVRDGSMGFERVPVDGSEKMDDNYMDAIEPFDYGQLKNFNSAFLSGYLAEKYDVDVEKSKERAGARIKSTIEKEFARSVSGYNSVITESSVVDVEGGKVSYCLFPVWILNTKYKKENYMFLMNGQSGRLVGKLPSDPGKAWKYRFMFAGISGAVLTLAIQALRIFL